MTAFKFLHRWLGVIAAVFILFFAISGIVLNHRNLFSTIDINRKYLPKTYHYNQWNLSAVKSATKIGLDSVLIYGNIGIWLTDSTFSQFTSFSTGIKKGIDNQRTASILVTPSGKILAGTMSGLYELNGNIWIPVKLPVKEKRITGMTQALGHTWILTRSNLLKASESDAQWHTHIIPLPYPNDFKNEISLFKALWMIHSGELFGLPGKIFVDFMGLTMIFLSLTGIVWFVAPDLMKSLRKRIKTKKRLAKINRFSLKWHNKLGIWTIVFLIILTITGMFLRPPLLIPIVNKSFPKLKYTALDNSNPWHDKLRDIEYDRLAKEFILSTSDGFFTTKADFVDSLHRMPHQPPISVMGINVFEQPQAGVFITGSFNGIHQWIPSELSVQNYITKLPVTPASGMANPFGSIPVAGYINLDTSNELIFDYNAGIFSLERNASIPAMPDNVKKESPISLWNLALEIHTGRIYSFMFGNFYILFIPLAGLVILIILVSGSILWFKQNKRKKNKKKKD